MAFLISQLWAQEVPEFKPAALNVFYEFQEFSRRVFDVLGVGLGLKVCLQAETTVVWLMVGRF